MDREVSFERFVEFFRQTIITGYGYDEARDAEPMDVLGKFIGPGWNQNYVVPRFVKGEVFGEGVSAKLDRYVLELDERKSPVGESKESYERLVKYSNPNVIWTHFDAHVDDEHNLLVLERGNLDDGQRRHVIETGEQWLDVLYDVEKRVELFWGWGLAKTVESIVAKVDPMVDREFVYQGRVTGFQDGSESDYSIPGMIVDGFEKEGFPSALPLINATEERHGHLVGQEVRYHFLDIIRDLVGIPYGELIHAPE